MNKNELTPNEQAIAQLFSVICAVVQSDHTPRLTIEATMQTLGQIFNNEDGPFNSSEDMQMMTMAMIDNINAIVDRKNKQTHAKLGNDILGNINWN
jgi:ABC-type Fe3+-hydroxamate transport system substrate-binding protein